MLIIARSAFKWKRIEMVVRRLLIWDQQRRICFMNGKNMGLKNGDNKKFQQILN